MKQLNFITAWNFVKYGFEWENTSVEFKYEIKLSTDKNNNNNNFNGKQHKKRISR